MLVVQGPSQLPPLTLYWPEETCRWESAHLPGSDYAAISVVPNLAIPQERR